MDIPEPPPEGLYVERFCDKCEDRVELYRKVIEEK